MSAVAVPILPLPHSAASAGVLRQRTSGCLRVDATAAPEALAGLIALAPAWGLSILSDVTDPDVVVRVADVDAPAAIGADPRPAARAGRSEAYRISVSGTHLVVDSPSPEGAFRGLVTVASACCSDALPGDDLPALEVTDAPRFAWRGLSFDVVRHFYPVAEVERIIDLLALHKFNVLHVHLTDAQGWRFTVPGYPALTEGQEHYTADDLDRLVARARELFITVVPEFDIPGHVAASVANIPGVTVQQVGVPFMTYLDWADAGVAEFVTAAFTELAARFDSPFLHLGGDEAFGASHEVYVPFVRGVAGVIRSLGRRPLGWQEAIRADTLGPDDLVQLWIAERDRFDVEKTKASVPEPMHHLVEKAGALFALSVGDPALIAAAHVPAIVSPSDPLYLDRRPSEPSIDAADNETLTRIGFPAYEPTPSLDILTWDPYTQTDIAGTGLIVSGIEAALWAETIESFEDASILLLPRLGLVAQRAWGAETVDVDAARAAVRVASASWERLGFVYYRSEAIFDSQER